MKVSPTTIIHWIDCKEQMPCAHSKELLVTDGLDCFSAYYSKEKGWTHYRAKIISSIIFWAPMPNVENLLSIPDDTLESLCIVNEEKGDAK